MALEYKVLEIKEVNTYADEDDTTVDSRQGYVRFCYRDTADNKIKNWTCEQITFSIGDSDTASTVRTNAATAASNYINNV